MSRPGFEPVSPCQFEPVSPCPFEPVSPCPFPTTITIIPFDDFVDIWLYTALQCWNSMSSNSLVFHTSGGISSNPTAFLFLIFLCTESSSSCVNCPRLKSS